MGKVRYYDCLNCKEYDTVVSEYEVTSKCLQIHISKRTSCGQFHTLDDDNNLVKYTEDGK